MVNSDGQLFTIEGIAAALIMLVTVYLVVNSTSIYTQGDTHINDMQLEVIGSDALKMVNTPVNGTGGQSPLAAMVENNDGAGFNTLFNSVLNNRTGVQPDSIQFMANVSYVSPVDMSINSTPLNSSRPLYGGEHAVHVSQWVVVENVKYPECSSYTSFCRGKHAALVEVLLWRD
jgi:hypothetical protein